MIILLLLLTLLFPSCKPFTPNTNSDIYLVSVADDFSQKGVSRSRSVSNNYLPNVHNDQASLISQFQKFDNVNVKAFIVSEGERYISSKPEFIAYDSNGNKCESGNSDFKEFKYNTYNHYDDKIKKTWDFDDVKDYLKSLDVKDEDIIIFTFSGHGFADSSSTHAIGDLVLSTKNSKGEYKSLSLKELSSILESLGGNKIVILDSCYSGNFIDWVAGKYALEGTDKFKNNTKNLVSVDFAASFSFPSLKMSKESDRIWAITATTRDQISFDSSPIRDNTSFQDKYGCLMYYILDALGFDTSSNTPKDVDKSISFLDIYENVRDKMPKRVQEGLENKNGEVGQTPQAHLNIMDILIHKGKGLF